MNKQSFWKENNFNENSPRPEVYREAQKAEVKVTKMASLKRKTSAELGSTPENGVCVVNLSD